MKYYIYLGFLLFIFQKNNAQDKIENKMNWESMQPDLLGLNKIKITEPTTLPFNKLTFIDNRGDKKCFGFTFFGPKPIDYRYVSIGKNPTEQLQNFYSKHFNLNSQSNEDLILVLHKFWLDKSIQDTVKSKLNTMNAYLIYGIFVQADMYIKVNNQLYKLNPIEGVYQFKWRGIYNKRGKMLSTALAQLLLDVKNNYVKNVASLFTVNNKVDSITTYNPIKALPKGVYLNFNSLINATPQFENYTLLSSKIKDAIVVNKDTLFKEVYAISDGKAIFLNYSDNYFKIVQIDGALKVLTGFVVKNNLTTPTPIWDFVFGGVTGLTIGLLTDAALSNVTYKKMYYYPKQINLTNGKLYDDEEAIILKRFE